MKKILLLTPYLFAFLTFYACSNEIEIEPNDVEIESTSVSLDAKKGKTDKVTICHKGKTITVNGNALNAHLNHGDVEGECYTQSTEWEVTFDKNNVDDITSFQPTPDGGFILGGYTMFNSNEGDIWVVKLNNARIIEWERTYGGSGWDSLSSIQFTSDGGYIIGGYTVSNDGDVKSGNKGQDDFWVIKINSLGEIQWEQTYGGSKGDRINVIQSTLDGGYMIGGNTSSTDGDVISNSGGSHGWLVKINNQGEIQWEKTYGNGNGDEIFTLNKSSENEYIMGGRFNGDYWISKIDIVGNIIWEHSYGSIGNDFYKSVQPTLDGGYLLGGNAWTNDGHSRDLQSNLHGYFDFWVVKTNSFGELEWEQTYGGANNEDLKGILPTSDGGYILGGGTYSDDGDIKSGLQGAQDAWVVKINSLGEIQWEQTYGGIYRDWFNTMDSYDEGEFVFGGFKMTSNGNLDFWLTKKNIN